MLSTDDNQSFARVILIHDRAAGSIGAFRQGNILRKQRSKAAVCGGEIRGNLIAAACSAEVRCSFESYDMLRIFAELSAYNTGSRRAPEKAGYTLKRTTKNNAVKTALFWI